MRLFVRVCTILVFIVILNSQFSILNSSSAEEATVNVSAEVPTQTPTPTPALTNTPTPTPSPTPLPTSGQATPTPETAATLTVRGLSSPKSSVYLLQDGQLAASIASTSMATFAISLSGITPGSHVFSVYKTDIKGRRSSTHTTSVTLKSGASLELNDLFLAPTVDLDKQEVKQGDSLLVEGITVPNSDVFLEVHSHQNLTAQTKAGADGVFSYTLSTSELHAEEHYVVVRAAIPAGIESDLSLPVTFVVGNKTVYRGAQCAKADLNCDSKVNLVDFSIGAFWYQQNLSAEFKLIEAERLNNDGQMNLVDFSIMAYYWTR